MCKGHKSLLVILVSVLGFLRVHGAQNLTFSYDNLNLPIPDQNPTGLASSQIIDVAPDIRISRLEISARISAADTRAFNGDLYMTLVHDNGFAVLLNRPGATATTPSGYSDNGMDVTFNDSAVGDIHNYRLVLSGNANTPLSGPLTGSWSPDGRDVDPDLVLDSSPRTAFLNSFDDLPLRGTWTLFVSDLSSGSAHQLDRWSINATVVPEPAPVALAALAGLLVYLLRRTPRFR